MIIALWLILLGLWNVPEPQQPPRELQLKRYASPSGGFVLEVDPTQRFGKGAGVYRMSHKGAKAWVVGHPFTLWDARVRDDGWTVGYAYTAGWERHLGRGELLVVSLSPQGEVVLQHSTARERSGFIHGPANPLALGLQLDPSSDQFAVRVADPDINRRIEQWWRYSIRGANREGIAQPDWSEKAAFDPQEQAEVVQPLVPPIESIELQPIEFVPLENANASTAQSQAILDFDFAAGGQLRVLRRANKKKRIYRVEIVNRQGVQVREVEFTPLPPELRRADWWPLDQGRWLVTGSRFGDPVPGVFLASEHDGQLTPVPHAFTFTAVSVVPVPGGGFVALVLLHPKDTAINAICRFDDTGTLLWQVSEDREKLFGPEDLALTPAGRIAVLDRARSRIQFFDLEGNQLEDIELDAILPQEPNYPTGLAGDPSGALLLHDLNADFPLHRIDDQGRVTASMHIVRPGAKPVGSLHDRAKVAPNGEIWTVDGGALLRISADGSIAETIGNPLGAETLREPGATRIDHLGRILIQDQDTGAVHAFNAAGRRLFTGYPTPGDFNKHVGTEIFVDASGSVYVQPRFDSQQLIHFSREGLRVGWSDLGSSMVAFEPAGGRWLGFNFLGFVAVRLMRGAKTVAEIDRPLDGLWFGRLHALAVDPAGSLAVLHSATWRSERSSGLSFYNSDGAPRATAPARGSQLALCNSWAAVWSGLPKVTLVRRSDNEVFEFHIDDAKEQETFHFGFSPDGKELWAIGGEGPALRRFALP